MEFRQRLEEMMKEKGWSMYKLAKQMDCSQTTISHWLTGTNKPQRGTMKRLADVFGVTVEYLQGEENAAAENHDSALQKLVDEDRRLLDDIANMSEEDKNLIRAFIRRLQNAD